MNEKQLTAMWIGIALIVLMGLFPPFVEHRLAEKGIYKFIGYHHFLTSWVIDKDDLKSLSTFQQNMVKRDSLRAFEYGIIRQYVKIDYYRLRLQWFLVALIAVGAIVSLRGNGDSKKSSSSEESPESN